MADLRSLQFRLAESLDALRIACHRLRQLEQNIHRFEEAYLAEVSGMVEQWLRVEPLVVTHMSAPENDSASAQLAQRAKQQYRTLLKSHHPDANPDGTQAAMARLTALLNDAGRQGDLAHLWCIELDAERERIANLPPSQAYGSWWKKLEAIREDVALVEHCIIQLEDSPSGRLMARCHEEWCNGNDLVGAVVDSLEAKLAMPRFIGAGL